MTAGGSRLGSPLCLLASLLLLGCTSIRVRRAEGPTISGSWRASALSCNELSPRTLQTLRRYDLEQLYPGHLVEIVARLHEQALEDPRPELLFALAEVNYLRGLHAQRKNSPDACTCYYLAAGYAYHYLFAAPSVLPDSIRQGMPAEAYDPRFRLACDLYNAGLAKCIAAARQHDQFDPRSHIYLPTPDGKSATMLDVKHKGFAYQPCEFGAVQLCSDYQVVGLANHHRSYGLGVPLIGSRAADAPPVPHPYYPTRVNYPITAFFRFEGNLADLHEQRAGRLELYNPLTIQRVKVGRRWVPLESDLTTPLAYFLAHAHLDGAGYTGFIRPDSLGEKAGLHTLEPYKPGKIPVIMVHGLLGSPLTWAPMFNDLQADPVLREHYQFWVYFYPTGNPYLVTAAHLRRELAQMRMALDPEGNDPALSEIVLVGHSMGGLVSRLLTIEGGDDFWKLVSSTPFDKLRLQPATRAELRNTFYFERQPYVTRAIFLGTPHRGSRISPSLVGRLGAHLAGLPRAVMEVTAEVMQQDPTLPESVEERAKTTSIDLLDPESPALQLIAHRPRPAGVRYHSVIGLTGRQTLLFERLLGGGYCQPSDGVVPYASAHLEDAQSEVVVPADHYHVHHHPLAILEVRRILLEHLQEFQKRHQTIRRLGGTKSKS